MNLKQMTIVMTLVATGATACNGEGTQLETMGTAEASNKNAADRTDEKKAFPSSVRLMNTYGDKLTFRELSTISGVDCKDPDKGLGCETGNYEVGDYSDVELSPDCDQHGHFAAVTNKNGAVLRDRAPPQDTVSLATLSEGQLVCIQATAHVKGMPISYYVVAVPIDSLQVCSETPRCAKYGGRKVEWHVKHEGAACKSDGLWNFSGVCAAGWVRTDDLDAHLNGF
ncbi:hypothetical protein [Dyella sp.]|uniref:hypothetical protein n=1 Tax=Dyella sp. TaxID=1869338 RepID=UPI002B46CEB8|nr:hypothetical protein [Dyella sp.]HKT28112.1 hypothetical protein [Dyella sp.]